LKQSVQDCPGQQVDILPEDLASYLGDAALLDLLKELKPDLFGFSVFSWNLERSLYFSERLKRASDLESFRRARDHPDNPRVSGRRRFSGF
jgi:hypothetical protein